MIGRVVVQFAVYPGPGPASSQIVLTINNMVSSQQFILTDLYLNTFTLNCPNTLPSNVYNWTGQLS